MSLPYDDVVRLILSILQTNLRFGPFDRAIEYVELIQGTEQMWREELKIFKLFNQLLDV